MQKLDFSGFPILVVDDEEDNLDAFRFAFRKSFRLSYAKGGDEALATLLDLDAAVIITDQRMPGMSGIDLLRRAREVRPDAVGVLITAYTDLPILLEAINSGAVYRYAQKPWDSKELSVVLRQAIERFYTLRENRRLRERLSSYASYLEEEQRDPLEFGQIVAKSHRMLDAVDRLEQLAASDRPVLLVGESGTEKELFARALHVGSARERGPFVRVTCAAWPGPRLKRELFGWAQGAFDGAHAERAGRAELADGGTLVLEGIESLDAESIAELSSLFDGGRVTRLGSSESMTANLRLVVTADRGLESLRLPPELAERLLGGVICIPPLRERKDDLPELCERFVALHRRDLGAPSVVLNASALQRLSDYDWPGNVRELSAVLERAVLFSAQTARRPTSPSDLTSAATSTDGGAAGDFAGTENGGFLDPRGLVQPAGPHVDLPAQLDDIERRELDAALRRFGGNKTEVAKALGIRRTTLYYRLKRLGIDA